MFLLYTDIDLRMCLELDQGSVIKIQGHFKRKCMIPVAAKSNNGK